MAPEASLAMPTGGRAGSAGAAGSTNARSTDRRRRAASPSRRRHRLRCRLEAVPAPPVRPGQLTLVRRIDVGVWIRHGSIIQRLVQRLLVYARLACHLAQWA